MGKINNGVITTLSALATPDFRQLATYGRPYVDFGLDNNLPGYIADLYGISPTHQAVIDAKRSSLNGDLKIIGPSKASDKLNLDDINGEGDSIFDILDVTDGDISVYEAFYWELIFNKAHTRIVAINHIPYENVRVGTYNASGKIDKVYISPDWSRKYIKKNTPKVMPVFNPSKVSSGSQILIMKVNRPNQPYYTVPSYMSAVQYILLEDDIAELQRNNIENGFFPSLLMNFFNGEPSEEDKADLESYVNRKFRGASGSKIMMFYGNDPDKKVQLDTFEQPNHAEYVESILPACLKKILTAHKSSPLMVGVHTDGGLSNKSEELEANYQLYMKNAIVPLQKLIIRALQKVYSFNSIEASIYFVNELIDTENYANGDASLNVDAIYEAHVPVDDTRDGTLPKEEDNALEGTKEKEAKDD